MPGRTIPSRSTAGRFVLAVAVLAWVWLLLQVWNPPALQWDFRSYHTASELYRGGGNPYDVHAIRQQGGSEHLLPFYYPLLTLNAMAPLCNLDYTTAYRLWFLLKIVALAATLLIWKRWFLTGTGWPWILTALLLGFGGAAIWDIRSGNVSGIEELLIWAGFAFLLSSRVSAFVACIVIAAMFKIVPAAFLLLLLLPGFRSRANVMKMAAGMIALAALVLLPFAGKPELLASFTRGLWSGHSALQYNPTFFGLLGELTVKYRLDVFGGPLRYLLLAVYTVGVLWISRRLLAGAFRGSSPQLALLVAVMLYALLVPRFVVYSYVIVLVPALALMIPLVERMKLAPQAAMIALCITGLPILPGMAGELLGAATPFLLLWACWIVLLRAERSGDLALPDDR